MPPEQAEGAIDQVDRRSDVFALGVMLRGLLEHSRRREPRLEAVIAKAQAPDPAQRYPSVEELADDVARFLQDGTVAAYRETALERVTRTIHRYRTPIAIVLVYVVIRLLILFLAGA
jgi:serine/threonine-protein kinase